MLPDGAVMFGEIDMDKMVLPTLDAKCSTIDTNPSSRGSAVVSIVGNRDLADSHCSPTRNATIV